MTRLERRSACKINLLLNILGKRPDGFHELESVMHPVPLHDELQFERLARPSVELTCNDASLPVDSRNLVFKAALAYLRVSRIEEGARIHLMKRIPLAAGLGGGSSNAAATLLGLDELFGGRVPMNQLRIEAAALGSDVPFFLQSGPALATGRGEEVAALEAFPALKGAFVVLIHPGFGVSTVWAYRELARFPEAVHGRSGRAAELIAALQGGSLEAAGALLFNSLEAPVLRKYPVLQLYQEYLRANGAVGALMSGSGSTTFGIFRKGEEAKEAMAGFAKEFGERCWTALVPLT
ncbi:MAG: 4-(cytidine 5'-diphospho)-2-C-methyl-D-erythritol kinase [Verrucomicrobiia bacterium]